MDLVMSHFAGIENIVATSGTAFADDQIKIIKRFADKVFLSFDADNAGEKAMKQVAIMCLYGGLDVYIIPKYNEDVKDVADLVLKYGVEA
jgi:DNA primase